MRPQDRDWARLACIMALHALFSLFLRRWWWAVIDVSMFGIVTLLVPPPMLKWLRGKKMRADLLFAATRAALIEVLRSRTRLKLSEVEATMRDVLRDDPIKAEKVVGRMHGRVFAWREMDYDEAGGRRIKGAGCDALFADEREF